MAKLQMPGTAFEEKQLRELWAVVDAVLALEPVYGAMPDDALRGVTPALKQRLAAGGTLDALLPDAFAACREASWRILRKKHYPVQLLGGIVLHRACIAEMKTGEGKTLVAVLPAYLNALTGKGVHVMTVNDYLAARDCEQLTPLFEFLGLRVGLIAPDMDRKDRAEAYAADITYGTHTEFGFDYLRDHRAAGRGDVVQRGFACAILDEADSILLDEANTPLIISAPSRDVAVECKKAELFVRTLQKSTVKELENGEEADEQVSGDYFVEETTRTVSLTAQGTAKAEWFFGIENLAGEEAQPLRHRIDQALRANGTMQRDTDYIVRDDEVFIVDAGTGRIAQGRHYSGGLHQAIEAKEGVTISRESVTLAQITYQNFFRMYQKLGGMTGTAMTDAGELQQVYGLQIVPVPTHRPVARIDHPDVVYRTAAAKERAVLRQILACREKGQPVLVGTGSVEESEALSALLRQNEVPHTVLNAKNHALEAGIVAGAGQRGAVTVATNMAGRGTDILLGEGVPELGGLFVLGTGRQESRRVDDQLRGRAGRQGDPGESRFYVSLEDALLRLFGGERVAAALEKWGVEEDTPIENRAVTDAIEGAQKRIEEDRSAGRLQMLALDDVISTQRGTVYREREEVLQSGALPELVRGMVQGAVRKGAARFLAGGALPELVRGMVQGAVRKGAARFLAGGAPEDWDLDGLQAFCAGWLAAPDEPRPAPGRLEELGPEGVVRQLTERALQRYAARTEKTDADTQRETVLRIIDESWQEHLEVMEALRDGIALRRLAQHDPVVEYRIEGFRIFDETTQSIQTAVARALLAEN